jgi:hypothetical protein
MNTKNKKLLLRKETVAPLSADALDQVAGGTVYYIERTRFCPNSGGTVYGSGAGVCGTWSIVTVSANSGGSY